MREVFRKFAFFRISVFSILIISPLFLLSEETSVLDKWIQEGNILLESKQFEEAYILANSILESDPSNSKAEFILTQAWIGIGIEEKKKGNFLKAKEYLEKAYEKWPLNESIRKELAELENSKRQYKKQTSAFRNNSLAERISNKSSEDLIISINLLRLEIEKLKGELETERKMKAQDNHMNWIYILFGSQIALLFAILIKIKR
ncbi:hypothetical protein V6Z05_10465 [Leptospira venezuelensis]|uniref:tetratricopeptide repeat protein n=1 Tax=Leptospira venezuelensis TaxID=1958811 RepID=UPI000A37FE34|nr:hypothetical protein [Leptospira venezuelensis]